MPSYDLEYPKQPYNTVNRYNNRASYALETIHQIINTTHFLNVSFVDPSSPYPVSLPMIGQMGSFERPSAGTGDVLDLYLHGYISSRLLNLSRKGKYKKEEEAKEEEEEVNGGLPVTVTATLVDGLVLALTPNNHSYNYRSATLFGTAALVTDEAEKLWAMELVTDGVVPGRWSRTRVPPTPAEMASTGLLRVRIASGSAKVRSGPPGDDRHDLENPTVAGAVWTGVVPVWSALGEPVPAPSNRVPEVPGYVADFVRQGNAWAREAAEEQTTKPMAPKKVAAEE
ncbi:flavin-nucleotide-binding protein [Xylariales sp. PMI_506]|nr:flavin-nucleotide-binding protein [Xylariales sp. PMI_506]